MITYSEHLREFFNDRPTLLMLLNIGIEIKKQKTNAGINENECYLNYTDAPDIDGKQYDEAIRKLCDINVITSQHTTLGYKVRLLRNKYLSIYTKPTEEKVKAEASTLPKNSKEADVLLGINKIDVNIFMPEYITKGLPLSLKHSVSCEEKLKFFAAVKVELSEDIQFFDILASKYSFPVERIKEELNIYYTQKNGIWDKNTYLGGVVGVKAVFKNHCQKKFVNLPEKLSKIEKEEQIQRELLAHKEKFSKLYKEFIDAYFNFHENILGIGKPVYGAREGVSMKKVIIAFLEKAKDNDEMAIEAIKTLFRLWKQKLSWKYVDKVSINSIASNLDLIINDFKNGKSPANESEQRMERLKNW